MTDRVRRVLFAGTALLGAVALAGCDRLSGRDISFAGAGVMLDQGKNPYAPQDLANLITEATPSGTATAAAPPPPPANPNADPLGPAIARFNHALYDVPVGNAEDFPRRRALLQNEMRDARNEVQGVLLLSSNNRCNAYKQRLRTMSADVTFALGSLATGLGAAGAVFTNATSSILAGAAAGTSGVNAEFQKDVMYSLTSSVIIPGIDKQRTGLLQDIANRRCLGLSSYPLSVALADVSRYHAACSLDVGAAAASSAVTTAHTQSIADVQAAIEALHMLKAAEADSGPPASKPAGPPGAPGLPGQSDGRTKNPTTETSDASPLVGDSVNVPECSQLDEAGLLPGPQEAAPAPTFAPGPPAALGAAVRFSPARADRLGIPAQHLAQ